MLMMPDCEIETTRTPRLRMRFRSSQLHVSDVDCKYTAVVQFLILEL